LTVSYDFSTAEKSVLSRTLKERENDLIGNYLEVFRPAPEFPCRNQKSGVMRVFALFIIKNWRHFFTMQEKTRWDGSLSLQSPTTLILSSTIPIITHVA